MFVSLRKLGPRNTVTSDFRQEVEIWPFSAFAWKICNITLIYGRVAKISAHWRKSGLQNAMVMSDIRPKVEIWPFRPCAMKNRHYNLYLWPNRRNFRVLKEIGVEAHDGVVIFKSSSGNMAVPCMRSASSHNYRNSSVTVVIGYGADTTFRRTYF